MAYELRNMIIIMIFLLPMVGCRNHEPVYYTIYTPERPLPNSFIGSPYAPANGQSRPTNQPNWYNTTGMRMPLPSETNSGTISNPTNQLTSPAPRRLTGYTCQHQPIGGTTT